MFVVASARSRHPASRRAGRAARLFLLARSSYPLCERILQSAAVRAAALQLGWSEGEAAAFAAFTSPNQLALALWSQDVSKHSQAVAALQSIQHVRDSYWRWLGAPEELHRRRNDILFIGRQEHLADDVRVLARHLKLDIGALPSDPIEAHRSPDGLDRHLDERAVANLMRWYAADYQAIELCAQIAAKAGFGGSLTHVVRQPVPTAQRQLAMNL